jgi:hypothetical protein
MPTLNFPDSPDINDIYSLSDRSWRWTGVVWESVAGLGPTGPKGDPGVAGAAGEQGIQGEPGETGIVAAISPILYDSETKTISIDESALTSEELQAHERLNIMGVF